MCKSFFCNTSAIGKSDAPVMMALKNKSVIGAFDGADKRGKHKPWNKTSPLKIATVIDHINIIPKMASHYCQKDSKKDYIDPDLTVPKLYDLYKIWLSEKAGDNPDDAVFQSPVSESKYREIFVSNFNISPVYRKKDQCLLCETWKSLTDEQRRTRSEEKLEHNCREQA